MCVLKKFNKQENIFINNLCKLLLTRVIYHKFKISSRRKKCLKNF
nr:MAG TPA: hypothetical protein [Caudoviricetes sp.]